jgi:hypothetical protein
MTHTGNTQRRTQGAQGQARTKPSRTRIGHTGNLKRAVLSAHVIQSRLEELGRDTNVKRILYKRGKAGVRVAYAYTRFQVAPVACRNRGPEGVGAICGDAWEIATYNLHTGKLIAAKCYVSGHQRVLNPRRVIAQFKRWWMQVNKHDARLGVCARELMRKLQSDPRKDCDT